MSKDSENPAKDARAERLATALRDNLKRRKAQARGRAEGGQKPDVDPPVGSGDRGKETG